jgi:hypothetical protein
MLVANLADQVLKSDTSLQAAIDLVWGHPQVIAELGEVLDVLGDAQTHVQHQPLAGIPLQVHAEYTRIEILAAVGEGAGAKTPQWREGVYDAKAAGADLLVFTLDKTSGDFSPTTRYRDYAISRDLIHWESQSTTRADSPTGRRYRAGLLQGKPAGETLGRPPGEQAEIARLRRELERTQSRLARTQTALEIMGKARELLEDISRSEPDDPDVFGLGRR